MDNENLIKSEVLTIRCTTVVKNKYIDEAKQLDMPLSNYLLYLITSQPEKALEVEQLKEVVETKNLLIEELKAELDKKNTSSPNQSSEVRIGFF